MIKRSSEWFVYHEKSRDLSSQAEIAARLGDREKAIVFYREAAQFERQSLEALPPNAIQLILITVVSVAALLFKAKNFEEAKSFIKDWIDRPFIEEWTRIQLQDILDTIEQTQS